MKLILYLQGTNVLRMTRSGGGEVSLISLKLILKINHAQEDQLLIVNDVQRFFKDNRPVSITYLEGGYTLNHKTYMVSCLEPIIAFINEQRP